MLGLSLGEAEKGDFGVVSRLLTGAAFIATVIGGLVAILNGVTSIAWILGAILAITAKIVDHVLYQHSVRQTGDRHLAVVATVLTYLFLCLTILVALGLFVFRLT